MKKNNYILYKNIFFVVLIILIGILFFILSYTFAINFFSGEINKSDLEIKHDIEEKIIGDEEFAPKKKYLFDKRNYRQRNKYFEFKNRN